MINLMICMQSDFKTVSTEHFKLRDPIQLEDGGWLLELWYKKDRRAEKLLVKTPRLKVTYAAKWFNRKCSYCVSLADRDLDDDIQDFWQFVRACDRKLVEQTSQSQQLSDITETPLIFKPSMTKSKFGKYMMNIRLITSGQGQQNIVTKINHCNRQDGSIDDIKYGNYVDQFIELFGVAVINGIIYPIWYAHQIVVSPYERVFLSKRLLDDISPPPLVPEPQPQPHPQPESRTIGNQSQDIQPPRASVGPRLQINPSMLLATLSKLKATVPENT